MGNAGAVVRVVSAALMLGLRVGYLTRAGSSEPLKRKPWLISVDTVRSPQILLVQSNSCAQRIQQVDDQFKCVAFDPVTLGRTCISLTSSDVSKVTM
jgi:hypothetical protein